MIGAGPILVTPMKTCCGKGFSFVALTASAVCRYFFNISRNDKRLRMGNFCYPMVVMGSWSCHMSSQSCYFVAQKQREMALYCKIMDVNLLRPVEEIGRHLCGVPGPEPVDKGKTTPDQDFREGSAVSKEIKQPYGVACLEEGNLEDLCTEEAILSPERNPSLGAIITSQCTTNAKAASAPKIAKVSPKMVEDLPSRSVDWYGWHKLSG